MSENKEKEKKYKDQCNCIKCDVCNCVHNDQHCGCTAKEIVVGPDFATSSNDTICGTFKKTDY